jgi:hypothetical protein
MFNNAEQRYVPVIQSSPDFVVWTFLLAYSMESV